MENFPEIRRQERVLDEARAHEILETGEYGFLSLGVGENGHAYGVPISYAYDREQGVLWFHCAPEGHKLDNLRSNPRVSFCVVGRTALQPGKFTTLYESVIVFGEATLAENDDERREAIRAIIGKYSPAYKEKGLAAMEKSLPRTQTFKITIVRMTGKCKK